MKTKSLLFLFLLSFVFISQAECKNKKSAKCVTQKEINELTLILTRYGNNTEGLPPLHYAVLKKDTKAINLLIKHGADPKAQAHNKYSCLYYAVKAGSIPLIKKFIDLGNSPFSSSNHPTAFGENALYISILYAQYEAAKYIITNGLHTPQILENDCFFLIAYKTGNFSDEQRKDLVKLMVQHGLDLNSKEIRGRTQLQEFSPKHPKDTEMADFLRSLGAE
jgi:ankyrin repeat protein